MSVLFFNISLPISGVAVFIDAIENHERFTEAAALDIEGRDSSG